MHTQIILSMADFILYILRMIGGIVWLSPGDHGWANEGSDTHTGMCYILGIATTVLLQWSGGRRGGGGGREGETGGKAGAFNPLR